MKFRFLTFLSAILCLFSVGFLSESVFAASGSGSEERIENKTIASPMSNKALLEQKKTVEEVNALIIDSYRTRLDRVLAELYVNIEEASGGNKKAQIQALITVRDDLDNRLDALAEANITANRKKILTGVYFYLKTSIEEKIKEIQGE